MTTPEELYPILVAEVADQESCDLLRAVAMEHEVVMVPLVAPPVDRRRHMLEVYAPSTNAMRFMAEPVGGPTEHGFPLRLEPWPDPAVEDDVDPMDDAPTLIRPGAVVVGRVPTSPSRLTDRHTRDLVPEPQTRAAEGDNHVGRHLANGKYRLDACVGKGGMGSVYRAHHRDLDLVVAVKLLHGKAQSDAGFAQRFQAEALTMSRIDHPNVVRVLDFGEEPDGLLYLVMEFLDGIDLQSTLEREGTLPLERLVRTMIQVCAALGHVHRHGIIHRDIKPTNILLVAGHDDDEDVPTEVAKVCDFGIALASGSGGRVAGTPHYMSPEQCRGGDVDARSDIYACGVLLYELATGKPPFDGESAEILRRQVLELPRAPSVTVPDIDPLFEAIVMKALSKDPAERQQTMRQLRTELKELLAPVLVEAGDAPAPSSPALPFEGFEGRTPSMRIGAMSIAPAVAAESPAPVLGGSRRGAGVGEVWLDDSGGGMSASLMTLAETVEHRGGYHDEVALADVLTRDPAPWLSTLAATVDASKFTPLCELLEKAVSKLMASADATTLAAIISTLRAIVREGPIQTNPRARSSGLVLRILRDPPRLAPLVDAALAAVTEPSNDMRSVFAEIKGSGAEALLAGRQRHGAPRARANFIALMHSIGAGAVPVLRIALTNCHASGERTGPFVEDLLRSVPAVPDEATGNVVSAFLQGTTTATTAAALGALANLWGDRARPMMLGALGAADDGIRLAAIVALRSLRAIDAVVVRHAEPILCGTQPVGEELRTAVASALGDAQPAARAAAGAVLTAAFSRSLSRTTTPTSGLLVFTLARSLLAAAVPNAPSVIREAYDISNETIRRQLAPLLQAR